MKNKKEILLSATLLAIFIAIIMSLFIDLYPLLKQVMTDSGNEQKLVSAIRSYGSKGVFSIIGLQALQAILVFVPSAMVQILAGLTYGVLWGSIMSLVGFALGNTVIFLGVKQFRKTVELFFPTRLKESKKKHGWLDFAKIKTMKRPEIFVFFSYLVPGVPNGLLPYVFAQSTISLPKFIGSLTLASVPSTIMWTWLGDSVLKKNYTLIAIIVALFVLIFLISLIFKKQIQTQLKQWMQ